LAGGGRKGEGEGRLQKSQSKVNEYELTRVSPRRPQVLLRIGPPKLYGVDTRTPQPQAMIRLLHLYDIFNACFISASAEGCILPIATLKASP